MQDYIEQALQTKSDQFHGELVSRANLFRVVAGGSEILRELDAIKKALFYGKAPNPEFKPVRNCESVLADICVTDSKAIDIIHAILGKATEAGELLEALAKSLAGDGHIDFINLREEVGDGMWYDAILLNAINSDIEETQRINIDKLRARFPNKFTEFAANYRDLDAERAILEGGGDSLTKCCRRAPGTWQCVREAGHDGPCAPNREQQD